MHLRALMQTSLVLGPGHTGQRLCGSCDACPAVRVSQPAAVLDASVAMASSAELLPGWDARPAVRASHTAAAFNASVAGALGLEPLPEAPLRPLPSGARDEARGSRINFGSRLCALCAVALEMPSAAAGPPAATQPSCTFHVRNEPYF